jgi:hypothetical protein
MAKKKVQILDLVPEAPSFKLSATGKSYRLRKLSALDEVQIERDFGGLDKLLESATKRDGLDNLMQVIYRQIMDPERSDFIAEERKTIDDDGNPVTIKVGGWRKFADLVSGGAEINGILNAFFKCMGIKVQTDAGQTEKKTIPPIGENSLTSSPQNTAGL